jgi:hypothetical protein
MSPLYKVSGSFGLRRKLAFPLFEIGGAQRKFVFESCQFILELKKPINASESF